MSTSSTAPCESANCANDGYKVSAGTLREYVDATGAVFNRKRLKGRQWAHVSPESDAYALGIEFNNPCPVYSPDDVIRVVDEVLEPRMASGEHVLHFAGLSFTQRAFDSARLSTSTHLPKRVAERKADADAAAALFMRDPSAPNALAFSEKVCLWGGGSRVWGNIKRLNGNKELGSLLDEWLTSALHDTSPDEELIRQGTDISGLGISFASKHLRILCPDRHAILDEVVSRGFGFANNPAGYRLFLEYLRDFKRSHNLDNPLSEIEGALFYLVRQKVRTP